MSATPREIVRRALAFEAPPRVPRDLWSLPIATERYPAETKAILRDFPNDFAVASGHERESVPTRGNPWAIGEFTDEWGCTFLNIQHGVIGEVKTPLIQDWAADRPKVHVPHEWLTLDRDAVNRDCAASDLFTLAGCCPRPFERLQFLRGSENTYLDLADPPAGMRGFLAELHAFYCELFTKWCETDIDAIRFMDDWGSQRTLLIDPALWREIFKPLYRDYAQIAHSRGKKIFMHSDGHIAAIYPELIEVGIDAVNSQIFCMGIDALAPCAGRITFWGEIDRQHLLSNGTPAEIDQAVREVHAKLWRDGGCIAQCEFGPGARPENVRQVFASWAAINL